MRGFPDVASREPMKAKFYDGELWKRELEAVLMPMLEKYDVVLVEENPGVNVVLPLRLQCERPAGLRRGEPHYRRALFAGVVDLRRLPAEFRHERTTTGWATQSTT